jgi:integrase
MATSGPAPRAALTYAGYERSVRIHIVPHLAISHAAAFADPPRVALSTMRVWTADELGRFLTAILGNRLYPRFLVLASTGMRRGEALGGRWEDLHAASAALPLTQGRCGRCERGVSTNSRSRWRGVRRGGHRTRVHPRGRHGPSPHPGVGAARCPSQEVGPAAHPPSRLAPRAVHAALAVGVNPKVVRERLGHSSVAFTLDRYSHVVPAMQEDAAETVARLISLDP